eukprot:CAMPEP_0172497284 /NCGR_PEP_ID=MMETSP1066-20121228/97592_1 /TAXON_ID=671091 /ORGANISM="Coscinodiscus wailesii, Strain CCMP2513" /LENGTH=104 /DNA_ID=CAMNT_0013269953 /DNA_START=150 /DNA_END=461 /DNA_ORIENTATION=+
MAESYEQCDRQYTNDINRVRHHLSSTRTVTTLEECSRLLSSAQTSAEQMEQWGRSVNDTRKIREAQRRLQQEVIPLTREVSRAKREMTERMGRDELFAGANSRR